MPVRNLFIAGLLITLTGCEPASPLKSDINTYQERLSHVLEYDFETEPNSPPAPLTFHHVSREIAAPTSISLLTFQSLQQCELGRLIAERNTALGKTRPASQQLLYEYQFIHLLDKCIETLTKDSKNAELITQLKSLQVSKNDGYATFWARVIETSQEVRMALTQGRPLSESVSGDDLQAGVIAIQYLTARRSQRIPPTDLETQLKLLMQSRLPARLWQTQQLLISALEPLNTGLKQQLPAVACPEGKASQEATILRNVFYLFFIERIQPVGGVLNRYHYMLQPTFNDWQSTDALSEEFKAFVHHHSEIRFTRYQQILREHVTLWQRFLRRCNLSPVAPSAP